MSFLQFIFPDRCISCDVVLAPHEDGICKECISQKKVFFATEPVCLRCGRGLFDETMEYCPDCVKKRRYFSSARAVFFYTGGIKTGIYRFKYSGRRSYARAYSSIALKHCKRWLERTRPDIIIPVPMYAKKERERGYNQARVFGRALSKAMGIPCSNCLKRIKNTTPLKLLSPVQRKKNIKGAFIIRKADIKYKKVLLVDDIYTTGATADECAKTLLANGASEIFLLSVCTGTQRTL